MGVWLPLQAPAHISSDVDANLGYSSIDILLGNNSVGTFESLSTVDLNYNLNINSLKSAMFLSLQEAVSSNYGDLVYTRLGGGYKWYFFGSPGRRVVFDNQVQGRLWAPSPFFGFSVGLSTFSLATESNGDFNATLVDGQLTIGAEIPLAVNWILVGKLVGISSLISSAPEGIDGASPEDTTITYTGLQIFAGIKVAPF